MKAAERQPSRFSSTGCVVEILFWTSFILVTWCFIGYPLLLLVRASVRPRPYRFVERIGTPKVSIVIAVRNGEAYLANRLANLLALSYPTDALEVIVVCNGCTDGSLEVALQVSRTDSRVQVVTGPGAQGKAGALNLGVEKATGEFVVFGDVRQTFDPGALLELLQPFADPTVGAVSGRLIIGRSAEAAVEGVRLYWGLETNLRLAESRTGSVVGVTGAIYAIRRKCFEEIPGNMILDDVWLPMRIAMRGFRVVLAPGAVARDLASVDARHEFQRKRRTMVGNLQLLRTLPGLLHPRDNPLFLRYIAHKLLRVASPFLFLAMLVSAAVIPELPYRLFAGLLGSVYLVGIVGLLVRLPYVSVASSFVMMHAAIFAALWHSRADASEVWTPAVDRRAIPRVRG